MKKLMFYVMSTFLALALLLTACGQPATTPEASPTVDTGPAPGTPGPEETATPGEGPAEMVTVNAGWVAAIDQLGLPVAVELGFFEDQGLEVNLAGPYPTGVDELNALQAGEIQFAQAGVPAIGAILSGMDLVMLGNYTGSSVQSGIDETMAMVASEGSGIEAGDLSTLSGKTIGAAVGSISHLYLLGVLETAGISPDEVEIINTPPPEMAVALQTGGVDAISIWDPWPIIALQDVEGTFEVTRGGGHISFIGYILAERSWVQANEDVVFRFLSARAQADEWIRENPEQAAEIAVRWLPGMRQEIAAEAMQFNIRQLDSRFSACNFLALDRSQGLLNELGTIDGTFDVSQHFDPQYIQRVISENPELFEDLPEIPQGAQIAEGFTYDRQQAEAACQ